MKKQLLSILLLLSLLCCAACQRDTTDTNNTTTPQASVAPDDTDSISDDTSSTSSIPPILSPLPVTKEQVHLRRYINVRKTPIVDVPIDWVNEYEEYTISTAAPTYTITFLGEAITCQYRASFEFEQADIILSSYRNRETGHTINIDENSKKLLRIAGVSYTHTAQTEQEYLAEVIKILGVDLSQNSAYLYGSNTTVVRSNEDSSPTRHPTPGFYIPPDSTDGIVETVVARDFYFYRYVNGIKTNEWFMVHFDTEEQTIYARWYDLGYTDQTFATRSTIDMERIVTEYLEEHLNPNVDAGSYTIEETMFVKNGLPYSCIWVEFESGDIVELFVEHIVAE